MKTLMQRCLLTIFFLLMTSLGVKAQGWTASAVANGNYYLYNVGAQAFLSNGASWGTHAVVANEGFLVNLSRVSDGVYTIGTNAKYSGKYFTDNGYVDTGSATNWTFEPVNGQVNIYKLKTSLGKYAYAAAGMYNVEIGTDPGNNMGWWKLVTADNRKDYAVATKENPLDLSYLIANSRFDSNTNGWSGDCTRGGNTGGSNGDVASFDNFNPCVERYHAKTDVYQTISGLPNGKYIVKCQGFYRADEGSQGPSYLYANDSQVALDLFNSGTTNNNMAGASTKFSEGDYWNTLDKVTVTDGTLKIGVKTDQTSNWTIWDNFQIFYLGEGSAAIADGTYFFKHTDGGYWMRGEPYGSAVQLYDWGLPVRVTTDDDGLTTLKFADASDWCIFDDGTAVFADNASHRNRTWEVTKTGESYQFKNAVTGRYMTVSDTRVLTTADANAASSFILVAPDDHQASVSALLDSRAAAVAGKAGLQASSLATLESAVAEELFPLEVLSPSTLTTKEKYQGGQWDSRIVFSNTVSVEKAGLYRFSLQGFYRMTSNDVAYALHKLHADCPPVYVFFDEEKVPIASVYDASNATNSGCYTADGKFYPNGQGAALTAFQSGNYANEVWVYIDEPGTYTYGIQYLGWAGNHAEWTCYSPESATLTYYTDGDVVVNNGILTAVGVVQLSDITDKLSADIAVADIAAVSGLSGATLPTANPNLLIYAKEGAVNNEKNVIVDATCANLELVKNATAFIVPKAFTAQNAKYTVQQEDLAGGLFATVMIPFAASSVPSTTYALDQSIDLLDGNVYATAVTSVDAGKPVLVNAAGVFTGSNVSVSAITKSTTGENGQLVGVYSATPAPTGSYVLQNHTEGEGVRFYIVGSTIPEVGPFRAYIKPQSSQVKAIRVNFDGADAIISVDGSSILNGSATYYSVDGVRLDVPRKGINIMRLSDGTVRKVLVK